MTAAKAAPGEWIVTMPLGEAPEWRREDDVRLYRALVDGRFPPLRDLNTAFTHARSADAMLTAYYGGWRVVAYLDQRFGFRSLANMLREWGRGRTSEEVFQRVLHVSIDDVDRDFRANSANQVWVSDITYIPTDEGWLYLAVTMDLFSRKIVGWSMRDHMRTELTSAALMMATQRQRPSAGLICHSDRGSQYVSIKYTGRLLEAGIEPSVASVGGSYDNALAETVNGLYKAGTNPIEATALVEAALAFMREDASRSLGIVTLNQKQRELVREEFEKAHPEQVQAGIAFLRGLGIQTTILEN